MTKSDLQELHSLVGLLGAIVVVFTLVVLLATTAHQAPALETFDGGAAFGLVDGTWHRRTHLFVLSLTGIACAAIIWVKIRPIDMFVMIQPVNTKVLTVLTSTMLIAAFAYQIWADWRIPFTTHFFGSYYGLWTTLSFEIVVGAAGAGLISLWLMKAQPRATQCKWLWILPLLLWITTSVPGIILPVSLDGVAAGTLSGIEWHFEAAFGPRFLLAAGVPTEHLGYGILPSLLLAAYDQLAGQVTLAGEVRLLQAFNLLYVGLILAACYSWRPSEPILALLVVALSAAWVSNLHQNLFFPNQSGWRSIGFPVLALLLLNAQRVNPQQMAVFLGALFSFFVFWNFETGVAIGVGCLVYLGARSSSVMLPDILRMLVHFVGGFLLCALLVFFLFLAVVGDWYSTDQLAQYVLGHAQGTVGRPVYFEDFSVILAGVIVYWLFRSASERRIQSLSNDHAVAAGLAGAMAIWASYYLLGMHPWNMWTYLFPVGLLMAMLMEKSLRKPNEHHMATFLLAPPSLIFAFFLMPQLVSGQVTTVTSLLRAQSFLPTTENVQFSGITVPNYEVSSLRDRAAALESFPNDTLVLTQHSYLLQKIAGRPGLFDIRKQWFRGWRKASFEKTVGEILLERPGRIAVDLPTSLIEGSIQARIQNALLLRLSSSYSEEEQQNGWLILRRKAAPETPL